MDGFSGKAPSSSRSPYALGRAERAFVIGELGRLGKGWGDKVEALLAMPEELFLKKMDGATNYSKEPDYRFTDVLAQAQFGKIPKNASGYGISVHSHGTAIDVILVDIERKIIVRSTLFSFHGNEKNQDKSWDEMAGQIHDALAEAASVPTGTVIISDDRGLRRISAT